MTPLAPPRVLVVDDDAAMRRTIERILSSNYRVEAAATTEQALDLLRTIEFQVALIDVQLNEDRDGYSLCQQINTSHPLTDVIMMTGSVTDPEEKLFRSLEEGAFYFLFKPFDRRVLRALLERCLRLQSERQTKELFAAELALDLEQARRFQQSLMPKRPLDHEGWRLQGRFVPCEALGGDFYFALPDRQGHPVFTVADITGHGVSAALYAGMLRSTLDAARRRHSDPADVFHEVRGGIDFLEPPRMATLFYGALYPEGRLRYVNAGHPPALLCRVDGTIRDLGATGLVLAALFADRPHAVLDVDLAPGDRLLVYSDGWIEARSPDDREIGIDALRAAFVETRGCTAAATLDRLFAILGEHCGQRPLIDDVTLLLIERA